jgi:hypothetical protein
MLAWSTTVREEMSEPIMENTQMDLNHTVDIQSKITHFPLK